MRTALFRSAIAAAASLAGVAAHATVVDSSTTAAHDRAPERLATAPNATYQVDLAAQASQNTDFRRVLHTGQRTQLVVMSIPRGGDIGAETHAHVEQLVFVLRGQARVQLGDAISTAGPGQMVVVPAGVRHNVTNTGDDSLQLYTIYAPPNHIDQRVHPTRAAADADRDDAAFGSHVR
jgi:mannose-6-phosphate isomerase-like protein (cupin superfamily)